MKYALIAMAVIYLITFGCSPEEQKKATDSHQQATHTAVQAVPEGGKTPAVAHKEAHTAKAVAEHKEKTAPAVQPTETQHAAIAQSTKETTGKLMGNEPQPDGKQPPSTEQAAVTGETATPEKPQATQDAAGEEMVTMPCGRKMAKKDIPAGSPCLGCMQQTAVPDNEELTNAMQKLVDATNNMVRVNRQMIIATQEMLNASKKIAAETKGKEGQQ